MPVGAIGGLLGLGGAEFRLPLLKTWFTKDVHRAVALNLAVSLVTIAAAIAARLRSAPVEAEAWWLPAAGLAAGATVAAWVSAGRLQSIGGERLERWIVWLLVAIGVLLVSEAFFELRAGSLVSGRAALAAALVLGAGIGIVSSLLGVAGGELLIPILVLVFGADVKSAGTLSVMVSLPAVLAGVVRRQRAGAYRREDLPRLVVPMGIGSIAGAFAGAALVPYVPAPALKVALGLLLIASAVKVFAFRRV